MDDGDPLTPWIDNHAGCIASLMVAVVIVAFAVGLVVKFG